MRWATVVIVGIVALALAGCGSDEKSSTGSSGDGGKTVRTIQAKPTPGIRRKRAKTVAKVESVCRRAATKQAAAGGKPTGATDTESLARLDSIYGDTARELEAVKTPKIHGRTDIGADIALRADLGHMSNLLDQVSYSYQLLQTEAYKKQPERARQLLARTERVSTRYRAIARKNGFTACYRAAP